MRRRFWLALDRLGHALPLRRFGRLRYAICLRADRYIKEGVPDGEDWLEVLEGSDLMHHFNTLPKAEVVGRPKVVVTSSSPFIEVQQTQTWGTGSGVTFRYLS